MKVRNFSDRYFIQKLISQFYNKIGKVLDEVL